MVIPQWRVGLSALAYRCGGSTGFMADHPIRRSPVSRLTLPMEEARHLERVRSISAARRARLLRIAQPRMRRRSSLALTRRFDDQPPITYSQAMDLDLNGLEDRIAQLIELSRRLRIDNGALRQQLVVAHNENKQLGERIEAARLRVEALLERVPPAAVRDEE